MFKIGEKGETIISLFPTLSPFSPTPLWKTRGKLTAYPHSSLQCLRYGEKSRSYPKAFSKFSTDICHKKI